MNPARRRESRQPLLFPLPPRGSMPRLVDAPIWRCPGCGTDLALEDLGRDVAATAGPIQALDGKVIYSYRAGNCPACFHAVDIVNGEVARLALIPLDMILAATDHRALRRAAEEGPA